jgi:manganese/zinc/iron transport system ATP- binding protein
MLAPSHGAIRICDRPLRGPDRRVVYVPQRSGVDWTFPVSVLDVVLMGRLLRRSRWLRLGNVDREAAVAALAQVGLARLADVQIGQLSGGQQQRVFLARALLQEGEILLLDEPFNGVDLPTQDLLGELFAGLRARGRTVVYATHDLERAVRTSDRVLLVNGRLVAEGVPSLVMTGANLRATFGGQAILLHDEFADGGERGHPPGGRTPWTAGSGR